MLRTHPWTLAAVLALAVGMTACGGDPNAGEGQASLLAPDLPTGDGISVPPSHVENQDPLVVVNLHAEAVSRRDFHLYRALLAHEFRFYPRDADADNLLCLSPQSDSWGAGMELLIWKHMTDPNFVGDEHPVEKITMDLTVLSSRNLPGGEFVVTADATILVFVGPDTGWATNTRLRFDLSRQAGSLRIDSIRESAILTGQAEEVGWGAIKCLYR